MKGREIMLEILKFVLSGFWIFVGMLMLLYLVFFFGVNGIINLTKVLMGWGKNKPLFSEKELEVIEVDVKQILDHVTMKKEYVDVRTGIIKKIKNEY